jgi:hypothetical protein
VGVVVMVGLTEFVLVVDNFGFCFSFFLYSFSGCI